MFDFGDVLRHIAADRSHVARATVRVVDNRHVVVFELRGGPRHGAIGAPEGEVVQAALEEAVELGVPVVGVIDSSGADVVGGVESLHAWGQIARALERCSGVVPTVAVVTGGCVSGPALLLGIFDVAVFVEGAFAYVTGPDTVAGMTGITVDRFALGGAGVHATRSGLASLHADDEDMAVELVAELLSYLPDNNLHEPPVTPSDDPADRQCDAIPSVVPVTATAAYDVREVIADIVDDGHLFELKGQYATNVVTCLARLDGHSVGVIANQPSQLAGTLNIEASQKAARFVQWCDAFNVPLLTIVDTSGFQPGKDLELHGIIRHGAQLVHAYAAATVPRLCVLARKAYGGAYIVMDSKTLGNDACYAWPQTELAVMGAAPAVDILHGRRLKDHPDAAAERQRLEAEYAKEHLSPAAGAARGYVDEVIDPRATRTVLCAALASLLTKRENLRARRHTNTPL